ncbi:MAG: response regulator [Ruminococcus sp.]|nr:response regulator [Ruminococcus sp.]
MAESPERAVELCLVGRIDLVLMDVVMGSGMDGLDAAKQIKEQCPKTKILLVTSMPEVSYIERAREIGIESFSTRRCRSSPCWR